MKRIAIFSLLLPALFALVGCEQDIYDPIEFEVTLDANNSYEWGDPVKFNFSGNADYIVLYTGEQGSQYANRWSSGGDDRPVDVKSLSYDVASYSYTYTTEGSYTATFIATSANIYDSSEAIRSVTFTITANRGTQIDPSIDDVTHGGSDAF